MSKWNEIIGYDNEKDYNWQDESVKLPKLNEEVLISWQDKQRPNRSPFVGYFKQTEFGVQTIISANDGMDFCPLQNGMKWCKFDRPDMRKTEQLLKAAKEIKEFCSNEGIINEENCPFFRGHKEENGGNIVQCALNIEHISPCNWKI